MLREETYVEYLCGTMFADAAVSKPCWHSRCCSRNTPDKCIGNTPDVLENVRQ